MARHDTNHQRLSRLIDDPVAASTTNGSEVTASLRNDYLNRANNFIQFTVLALSGGDWTARREKIMRYIPGLVTTQAITWASGGTTVGTSDPNGYSYWLEVRDTTGTSGPMTYHPSKIELDDNVNSNLYSAFTILGGKIYGYKNGSQLTTGATGTLYYVTSDIQTTADATPNIDAIWDDALVSIAASFYHQDKGLMELGLAHLQRTEMVLSKMRGM